MKRRAIQSYRYFHLWNNFERLSMQQKEHFYQRTILCLNERMRRVKVVHRKTFTIDQQNYIAEWMWSKEKFLSGFVLNIDGHRWIIIRCFQTFDRISGGRSRFSAELKISFGIFLLQISSINSWNHLYKSMQENNEQNQRWGMTSAKKCLVFSPSRNVNECWTRTVLRPKTDGSIDVVRVVVHVVGEDLDDDDDESKAKALRDLCWPKNT